MSKGIRQDTIMYVETRREEDPLALGPYLGALAIKFNLAPSLIAVMTGAHEQTVLRWLTMSVVQPMWALKVAKVIALLSWMHDTEQRPLHGYAADREKQLTDYMRSFNALVRGSVKNKARA